MVKKLKYNVTDKYTGSDFTSNGTSKDEGFNCLSLCLAFCKDELDMPYDFGDEIVDDISWDNLIDVFKDNPKRIFNELETYFLNYYDIIPPHEMRKGDVIVIDGGDNTKSPCVFVGNNKILVATKDKLKVRIKNKDDEPISINNGVKVVDLGGVNIFNVYRVRKKPRKITTKAVYKMGENPEDFELVEEESRLYDGDIAECALPVAVVYIIKIIVAIIISYLVSLITQPDTDDGDADLGRTVNTRSTQESLKVVYGLQRVAGNDVFMETAGDYHRDLYIIQTLSEGECEGINQVTGVDQIFIDDKIYTDFGSKISYQFYSGSSTQTYDTTINSIKPTYTDNMRYTSYIRWSIEFDKDLFVSGKPTRLLELKGRKVYDFRNQTTAWSQNGVLCLYDFFTNNRYGLGVDATEHIDITSWTTAANYVATKGWLFNYVTGSNKNPWSVAQEIMKHFRCVVTWFNGKYYLLIADINEESSVMTITDEHIVQRDDGKALVKIIEPNRFNTPNAVRVKFIDKDKSYTEDDIYIGEEGGVVQDISLMGYTDRETVSNLATYYLERARLNRTVVGTFRDECLELSVYDLTTFNSTALGIADQVMRVVSTSYNEGLINLTLQYENEELYDDDYDVEIEGTYTCTLPDPNVVMRITNTQISEQTFHYGLRTESRLRVTFTVPEEAAWFKHCEVWQVITTVTGTTPVQSDYEHQFNTTNNFNIDHVEQGQKYYLVLIPVSIFGVKDGFDDSPKVSHVVAGNAAAPQSLLYLRAIFSSHSLSLFSDKLDDPDIEIYEFRLGTQWNGAVFLSAKRSPHEQLPGVKPGVHTFFCNTKGTNGLYGINPQSASATISEPVGWTLSDSFTDDYTGAGTGTFTNTEHTIYASEDYLQCSHTGGNLTGTYESIDFDTGVAAEEYYMYLDAEIAVTGSGTLWTDVFTPTTTWDDVGAGTKSWNETFGVEEAPEVNIIIYHKDTGDWIESTKAEILSAIVTARYFKVWIEIIDPTDGINAKVEHFTLKLYTKT